MSDKRIIIIAGPNGAGKTTFANEFLPEIGMESFINADLIAADLSPANQDEVAFTAARKMLEKIDGQISMNQSFVIESTLSGRIYAKKIREWQSNGYEVILIYLALHDVRLAIERVAERVKQGGHNVPEAIIRRRYVKGMENFYSIYRALVDEWAIYDNSGAHPQLVKWSNNDEE
jgi:predicted ABC-type ATPase